jgi:hypothetical protein
MAEMPASAVGQDAGATHHGEGKVETIGKDEISSRARP